MVKKLRHKYKCQCCQTTFQSVLDFREHECLKAQHIECMKIVFASIEYFMHEAFEDENNIKIVA